jgi:putative ABC transport system permease protein
LLVALAWKNVWRTKKRSLVLLAAVALGVWGGLFACGIMFGMTGQMVTTAISTQLSDIQIHKTGFLEDRQLGDTIPDIDGVLRFVRGQPFTAAAVRRMVISGMVSSPANSQGVRILGIEEDLERKVTDVADHVIEGAYFGDYEDPVVIGKDLADKLGLNLGSKLVLTFQGEEESIVAGAFRICGIFKTASSGLDRMTVFVRSADLMHIIGPQAGYHEVAVLLRPSADLDGSAATIRRAYPGLSTETWKQLAPELDYLTAITARMLYIFLAVVMLGLLFGVTNTMLMSLLDRIREFGMLVALGMEPRRLFTLLTLEAFWICCLGGLSGTVGGYLTLSYFGHVGIDLSRFAQGLGAFGVGSRLYTSVPPTMYAVLALLVVATAFVSTLFPGVKAVRLNPAKAMRAW